MKKFQFVNVSSVIGQMCIAHARASLPQDKEYLPDKDYRTLIKHEEQVLAYRYAKARWDIQMKVCRAYNANTGPSRQGPKPTPPGKEPQSPTIPDALKEFWTLVEIEGADNHAAANRAIEMHIYEGRIPAFILKKSGIPERLTKSSFLLNRKYGETTGGVYWTELLPWVVRKNRDSPYFPVVILREDFDYFMDYGTPKPDERIGLQKSKTGSLEQWPERESPADTLIPAKPNNAAQAGGQARKDKAKSKVAITLVLDGLLKKEGGRKWFEKQKIGALITKIQSNKNYTTHESLQLSPTSLRKAIIEWLEKHNLEIKRNAKRRPKKFHPS